MDTTLYFKTLGSIKELLTTDFLYSWLLCSKPPNLSEREVAGIGVAKEVKVYNFSRNFKKSLEGVFFRKFAVPATQKRNP